MDGHLRSTRHFGTIRERERKDEAGEERHASVCLSSFLIAIFSLTLTLSGPSLSRCFAPRQCERRLD